MGLTIAVLADIHACWPWMTPDRIRAICRQVNALEPDIAVLLGDYVNALGGWARPVAPGDWAAALATLDAPLGGHAVLGNHDWWADDEAQASLEGPVFARRALEAAGIAVYENDAARLDWRGGHFWLAGLADQRPLEAGDRGDLYEGPGLDDLDGTLAQVTDDAPVVLMAHEPDIFPRVPRRVALTLAGHTHDGQVRVFGWTRWTSSAYGDRFARGHIREDGRDLIVSAGLGLSGAPLRIGAPAEIVVVELGRTDASV